MLPRIATSAMWLASITASRGPRTSMTCAEQWSEVQSSGTARVRRSDRQRVAIRHAVQTNAQSSGVKYRAVGQHEQAEQY
jgi:hypothetical protein